MIFSRNRKNLKLISCKDLFFLENSMNTLCVHVNNVALYGNKIRNVAHGLPLVCQPFNIISALT